MEGRVQVISRDIVKPSSETPHHLRKLKLSYLDQLVPAIYVPLIFFYQADELRGLTTSNHHQVSQQLKQSLSNTLTSFYPLAGRIQDSSIVDCSDAGCEFIEVRVHTSLMNVIQEPSTDQLKQFLPMDLIAGGSGEGSLVLVQATFFDCGGIAIGICISHQIADCSSIMGFINAWAATCRGKNEFSRFSFDLGSYFPARDNISGSTLSSFLTTDDKLVIKRFLFDKEKVTALKKYATGSNVNDPTRVEVISAFIWKHVIEVAKLKNLEAKKTFAAMHVVNLRARKTPPQLLENVFGNCIMSACAFSDTNCNGGVDEFHNLLRKLRNTIKTVSDDYITKAQSGDNYLSDRLSSISSLRLNGGVELCVFSSWSRFPVYEVDYGWGNPIWFCATVWPRKNTTIFVSSRYGDGIEAWVSMNQDDIEMLETKIKLLSTTKTDINS